MKFKDLFQSFNHSPSPLPEEQCFYKIGPDDRVKISAIREIILFEAKNDPKSITLEDVERIENDDIFIFRFISQHDGHLEAALKTLRKSLRWRKENRVNQLNMYSVFIPKEVAKARGFHSYVRDKNGTPTIYSRPCAIPPRKFKPLITDSVIYFGELVSRKVSQYGRRFGFISDCSNLVFHKSMLDFELFREVIKLRDLNYPDLYAYVAFYEFPVSLKWLFKLVSPMLPKKTREKIIFIDKDTIDDFIGLDNVPDYMGGRCKMPYHLDPDSFPPIEEALESRGYTKVDVDELREFFAEELKKFESELSKPDLKFIKLEELENYFD